MKNRKDMGQYSKQFKTTFYGVDPSTAGAKPIFILNCHVLSEKRESEMTKEQEAAAVVEIESFIKKLRSFKKRYYRPKKKTGIL